MSSNDGGYYAIKGFLYQFDKSLIEILRNPENKVGIEKTQDVNINNYAIQVKYKETQNYSPSKIKHAVIQLLELFKNDKSQKFSLYCYFKNKSPQLYKPSLTELDKILGDKKDEYLDYLKKEFKNNFQINFSDNFEKQFEELINLIKNSFSLSSNDKAIIYHSIFRSRLFDISIKTKDKRDISKNDLLFFIEDAEKTIFYSSYSKYLGREKYEKIIRKDFFTFKRANINNFERLFIIDCHPDVNLVDINKIVNCISKKYFKLSKSPQPILCFLNLQNGKLIELKQELIDQGIMFNDGTFFNGDRFRLDRIIENELTNDRLNVKIVDFDHLYKVLEKIKIREIYQFYIDSPVSIEIDQKHIKIQIEETNQISRMIC
jgi:hypothetical protein